MSQARHMTVFGSLTQTVQSFLHLLGAAAKETDTATGSAGHKTGTEERMSNHNRYVARDADEALGSVLFAIGAYGRYGLLAVAEKLLSSRTAISRKSLVAYSDGELRKELSKRAKRLRKENPAELIQLRHYLIEFSQNRIAKAGD